MSLFSTVKFQPQTGLTTSTGFDGVFSHGGFVLQSEIYKGQFSILPICGYSVLTGYQPAGKKSRRYYARWSAINNGLTPTANATQVGIPNRTNPFGIPDNSLTAGLFNPQMTWNIQQFTVGIVQPISNGVWAELEYERNTESIPPGVSPVYVPGQHDLLFVEFFTGF